MALKRPLDCREPWPEMDQEAEYKRQRWAVDGPYILSKLTHKWDHEVREAAIRAPHPTTTVPPPPHLNLGLSRLGGWVREGWVVVCASFHPSCNQWLGKFIGFRSLRRTLTFAPSSQSSIWSLHCMTWRSCNIRNRRRPLSLRMQVNHHHNGRSLSLRLRSKLQQGVTPDTAW